MGRPLADGPLLELLFFRADLIDRLVGRITLRLGLKCDNAVRTEIRTEEEDCRSLRPFHS